MGEYFQGYCMIDEDDTAETFNTLYLQTKFSFAFDVFSKVQL